MTDRLQEIRARLDAASPGPWGYTLDPGTRHYEPYLLVENKHGAIAEVNPRHPRRTRNADLIAHAPADIAWLLDELRVAYDDIDEAIRKGDDAADYWMQEAKRLREYAVHKHNDCWQHGKCKCGLDDSVVQGVTKLECSGG